MTKQATNGMIEQMRMLGARGLISFHDTRGLTAVLAHAVHQAACDSCFVARKARNEGTVHDPGPASTEAASPAT